MENNIEPIIRQEMSPLVTPEKKEEQSVRPDTFFDTVENDVAEGTAILEQGAQGTRLAGVEEFGTKLHLTNEEVSGVLEEGGFVHRLNILNEKARAVCTRFVDRAKKIGGVATTALVLGAVSPAYSFAEEQGIESPSSPQTINEFAQVAQIEKKEALPTYEEAMKRLHESVMTDTNERMLVSVKGADGKWVPIALTEGGKTSVGDPKEFFEAIKKGEDIEEVHTHPLEAFPFSGVLSNEGVERVRNGEESARVMAPSGDADFMSVIVKNREITKSGGKVSYKVIDPTGEWSFGIADNGAPWISSMNKLFSSFEKMGKDATPFSENEKKYASDLQKEFPDQRFFMAELHTRAMSGGVARTLSYKLDKALSEGYSKASESMSKEEQKSNEIFSEYLIGNQFYSPNATNEQKNKEDIEFYTTTARKLGFSLKYTPNKKAE